jgi:hypothetical protein
MSHSVKVWSPRAKSVDTATEKFLTHLYDELSEPVSVKKGTDLNFITWNSFKPYPQNISHDEQFYNRYFWQTLLNNSMAHLKSKSFHITIYSSYLKELWERANQKSSKMKF